MIEITTWLEEKIPFDLSKLSSLLVFIILESVSLIIDAFSGYNFFSVSQNVSTAYSLIESSINETTGLLVSAISPIYPVSTCKFMNFTIDTAPTLINNVQIMAYIMFIFTGISGICFVGLTVLKIIKLVRSINKPGDKKPKSQGNPNKSIVGDIYDGMWLVLLLVDDILFLVLVAHIYSLYNGLVGFGCLICLLQVSTCKKDKNLAAIISSTQTFLILCLLKTLILSVKKLVLGFFNWTKTGTVFDLIIIRLLATVTFTILSFVIVFTPALFILKTEYFPLNDPNSSLASVVSSVANIGLLLWGGIILIATCIPIVKIITS